MFFKSFFLIAFSALAAAAQTNNEFYGKLIGLIPQTRDVAQRLLKETSPTDLGNRFNPPLESGAVVSKGLLADPRNHGKLEVMLVETSDKLPYLAIDLDNSKTIEVGERFALAAVKGAPGYFDLPNLLLPIANTPLFKSMPVFVRYIRGITAPGIEKTDRLVIQSVIAHALGDVNINGKIVRFQYPFDPSKPVISTTEGLFGIDVNGDQIVDNNQFSPETSYSPDGEIVFRYGDMYLSTASIDVAKNQIIVRRRSPDEYHRIDLEIGKEMPDFAFTDIEGKKHSLSEFRGKYVLVDFWGMWCPDCVREIPTEVKAYEKFHARGFEILGMDWDDNVDKVTAFMQKNRITWPQARKDSIRTLAEVSYRIQEFPSSVLLGPDGKVLVLDQKKLQGEELSKTLDKLLVK
jgi:peroxiredoxin